MKRISLFVLLIVLTTLVGFTTTIFAGTNQQEKETPHIDLHTAVIMNDLKTVQQHIDTGSDLNIAEQTRQSTPLITASVFGKTEAAKLLIEAGADLDYKNADSSTALHTAAFFGQTEIVKCLLEHGANKTLKNGTGLTAYETVIAPFEKVKSVYDAFSVGLKPLGIELNYDRIKAARPVIAEMLK